jgi:hypothetical protein
MGLKPRRCWGAAQPLKKWFILSNASTKQSPLGITTAGFVF